MSDLAVAMRQHTRVTEHYMDPNNRLTARPDVHIHRAFRPPGAEGDRLAVAPNLLRAALSADVIHVHQYGALTAQLQAVLARLWRKPIFVTDLGASGVAAGRRLGLSRLFNGYLSISEFAADDCPPDRTRVVYGGVQIDRFLPQERSAEPYVLFVGRLLPHKGIDWLIRSMPPARRLVIAGRVDEGHAPGYLRLLRDLAVGRDVDFVLDPSDLELAELYGSAWAVALTSVAEDVYGTRYRIPELLGLTLLEGMASARPVIASDVGPLPEVVDESCGVVVPAGDVEALRTAIERVLSDRTLGERLGAQGRERVLRRFRWSSVAEACLVAYRELG